MPGVHPVHKRLFILLIFSAAARALIAGYFELGNDEVYYWTYALNPDFSYYDHPPMVGWLIRLFTFNLHFQQEIFLRLSSILAGTLNTILIYLIGKQLKDKLTGWYAAVLYTASIYGFVITGIFILPDTGQSIAWLASLLIMLKILPSWQEEKQGRWRILWIGLLLGLGMLSKYTTAFLWLGMILFILFHQRPVLKDFRFYLSNLILLALFSIVLIWNFQHHFVSFLYQGGRAGINETLIHTDSFLLELGGEFLYHNPASFILFLVVMIAVLRNKGLRHNQQVRLLLLSSLPLILVFLTLSLFRNTLPHWSGLGYVTLIPVMALWVHNRQEETKLFWPPWIYAPVTLMVLIVLFCMAQIKTGVINLSAAGENVRNKGSNDISLQLYGWKQLGEKFRALAEVSENIGLIQPGSPIVSYRWFPAANQEYYLARPINRIVLASGPLDEIHNYAWLNRLRGGFNLNTDAWYITSSLDFEPPDRLKPLFYQYIMAPDTITIEREGQPAYYCFVYRLINMQARPAELPDR